MNFLRSVIMSFSMFSKIPMPRVEWKKENMSCSLGVMPLVGAVIGLILYGWHVLCGIIGFGNIVHAVGLTLIPLLITGGIHLDGYCDTIDALSSHAEKEKKRAILKDPHAGAFAIIWCGIYLLAYFAFATELCTSENIVMLGLIHVISRALTAVCSLVLPSSGLEGLLASFKLGADKITSVIIAAVFFTAAVSAGIWLCGIHTAAVLFGMLTVFLVWLTAKKQFGGMSGDISGFMLQLSELIMLLAYIVLKAVI